MTDQIVEERFPVGTGSQITISNISGTVKICGADTDAISMRACKRGRRRSVDNTRIEWRHEGGAVHIHTKGDKNGVLGWAGNVSAVDYQLTVPWDCRIDAQGASASLHVEDISADAHLKTASGGVVTRKLSGNTQIFTVSGDTEATDLDGSLNVRTASGDTTVSHSRLVDFHLTSVSGNFRVETPLHAGRHYFANTISGDLTLQLDSHSGVTVHMKSVSGGVKCDVPAEIIKASKRNWQGRINGGGATLEMTSVSGDMLVCATNAILSSEPRNETRFLAAVGSVPDNRKEVEMVPKGPASPQSADAGGTSAVLLALERGDITVNEAMVQLQAAG